MKMLTLPGKCVGWVPAGAESEKDDGLTLSVVVAATLDVFLSLMDIYLFENVLDCVLSHYGLSTVAAVDDDGDDD